MGEPFREGKVLIEAALEHLQKFEIGIAGILDVMGQRFEDIADVSGLKVHGASAASRGENRHSSGAADKVLPFISIGMPVQFANASGMDGDDCGRDRRRDFELAGIDDPHLASLGAAGNGLLGSTKSEIQLGCAQ